MPRPRATCAKGLRFYARLGLAALIVGAEVERRDHARYRCSWGSILEEAVIDGESYRAPLWCSANTDELCLYAIFELDRLARADKKVVYANISADCVH